MSSILKFANSFQKTARLRLESIAALCNALGNPQNDLKFIHVAGTNGKGSVCTFLQNILTRSGFKTGKYTSPNLVDVCERISIDNKDISKEDMEQLLERVGLAARKIEKETGDMPTPFEIWTASAFLYFREKSCDYVVLETGLGGTRDATNVIPAPEFAVITRIALDHTEYLGNTLSAVAGEKAGIIKKGSKVITINQNPAVLEVLSSTCEQKGCSLFITQNAVSSGFDKIYENFSYMDMKLTSGLGGYNQIENACLAAETALRMGISPAFIQKGIKNAVHKGRFETVTENPLTIFDGAHNNNGMSALVSSLKRYFPNENPTFVMGVMADKSYGEMLDILKKNKFLNLRCVTVSDNPRAESASALRDVALAKGFFAESFSSLSAALAERRNLTVICGSLYLYKDFVEISSDGAE